MKKKLIIIALLPLLLILNCGRETAYDKISAGILPPETAEIPAFPRGDYGYIIYDPEKKETVKSHNIRTAFIPASVSKLFTAVLAQELLTPDYKFTTSLLYTGKINNGELYGDLILKGGGDPELSIQDLIQMISELKALGIKKITGQFYYDIESFTAREFLDPAMPVNARYNPGYGPLNLNRNTIYAIKRINDGKLTSVDLLPSLPSNRSYLYDGPHVLLYSKYLNDNGIETWGLPSDGNWENRLQLPVKNTAMFTSSAFRKLCAIQGIAIPSPRRGVINSGSKKITVHKSRELTSILNDMLVTSDNLTAEIIGTVTAGELNSRRDETPERFFRKTFPSINWDGFRLTNYSGLTDLNRATPEQTAAMLMYLDMGSNPGLRLSGLLPLSGVDGTMKSRLDKPDSAFRVYAKTGSIYYASALAGEFTAASGKKYLFSVFIDSKELRRKYSISAKGDLEEAKRAEKWSADSLKAIEDFIYSQIIKM